jgi:hypothetical protein
MAFDGGFELDAGRVTEALPGYPGRVVPLSDEAMTRHAPFERFSVNWYPGHGHSPVPDLDVGATAHHPSTLNRQRPWTTITHINVSRAVPGSSGGSLFPSLR